MAAGGQYKCFWLTEEQVEWMKGLFAAEEWGWPEVKLPPNFIGEFWGERSDDSEAHVSSDEDDHAVATTSTASIPSRQESSPPSYTVDDTSSDEDESPRSVGRGGHRQDPQPNMPPDPTPGPSVPNIQDGECASCFLQPCVAEYYAGRIGQPRALLHRHRPHPKNSGTRKGKYRQFWKQINKKGGWKDPRYLALKEQRMRTDGVDIVKREVMPDCVTALVRDCYPNPSTMPYLGHRWN
ncbi:Hypp6577 [Branchiostoma lanceolatum]|uniref:Hypp6577 protein n=1 Tax=Branchiostoma lanceolatum TaxID=7740 RepID=A0A8K0E5B8_BRALA|nr:Hypp6577 [Branchiostoma lanceolatum]